jgi:hypothetical protein
MSAGRLDLRVAVWSRLSTYQLLKRSTIRIRGSPGQLIVEHSEQVIALERLAQVSVAPGFHRARYIEVECRTQ